MKSWVYANGGHDHWRRRHNTKNKSLFSIRLSLTVQWTRVFFPSVSFHLILGSDSSLSLSLSPSPCLLLSRSLINSSHAACDFAVRLVLSSCFRSPPLLTQLNSTQRVLTDAGVNTSLSVSLWRYYYIYTFQLLRSLVYHQILRGVHEAPLGRQWASMNWNVWILERGRSPFWNSKYIAVSCK